MQTGARRNRGARGRGFVRGCWGWRLVVAVWIFCFRGGGLYGCWGGEGGECLAFSFFEGVKEPSGLDQVVRV